MSKKVFYKYRDFNNRKFIKDIFQNQRLFASDFKPLNDPMEGIYDLDEHKSLNQEISNIITDIRNDKHNLRILSLCNNPFNPLMWSYYSDGSAGFVIGFEMEAEPLKVEYVDKLDFDLDLQQDSMNLAKAILNRKLSYWKHEQEYRVIEKKDPSDQLTFIPIKPKKLIFGLNTSEEDKVWLTDLANEYCELTLTTIELPNLKIEIDGYSYTIN